METEPTQKVDPDSAAGPREAGMPEPTRLRPAVRTVAAFAAPYRRHLLAIAAVALVGSAAEAGALVVVASLATAFAGATDRPQLPLVGSSIDVSSGALVVAGFLCVAVRFACFAAAARIAAAVSASYERSRRHAIVERYLGASWELQSRQPSGAFQDMLTWDVETARSTIDALARGLAPLVGFVSLVVIAFVVSPATAAVVLVAAAALAVAVMPLAHAARRLAERRAALNSTWADELQQLLSVAREIQVFGSGRYFTSRSASLLDRVAGVRRRADFVSSSLGVVYQTVVLLAAVAALAVVYAVDTDLLQTLGPVALLLIRALTYSQSVQQVVHTVVEREPYLRRLHGKERELGDAQRSFGARDLDRVERIELADAGLVYPGRGSALRGVSLTVDRGECIGIVGPSGSGKSTLVQILLRLLRPTTGRVLVNGVPADEYAEEAWARAVAYVPQEPVLLRLSVADNIRFGRSLPLEDVHRAARAANVAEEIEQLPAGYDEPCGERGSGLSGGQRQRICIARALAADPSVIVFDEPTSALDPVSESAVRRTLADMRGDRTLFIVTHRAATLDVCDRVLVLDAGSVKAFAPPSELAPGDRLRAPLNA